MKRKLRAAQIGTAHDHASVTYGSLRKLTEDYEVIGVAEPVECHKTNLTNHGQYRGTAVYTKVPLSFLRWKSTARAVSTLMDTAPIPAMRKASGPIMHCCGCTGE
ncbi:MAG: hypothetical protein IJ480_07705 [Clostridia bacterium]|nr:hypothetical protein [Clostridia bacterium]